MSGGGANAGGASAGSPTGGGATAAAGTAAGGMAGTTGSGGFTGAPATLSDALRYQTVRLHVAGSANCVAESASGVALAACGGENQQFRVQVLNADYLSLVANSSGSCLSTNGSALALAACTNAPAQQFSYQGSASPGYQLGSFSAKKSVTASLGLGEAAAAFEVLVVGEADPVAVVVDERAIGWATMAADIIVPDDAVPNGDEGTRAAKATTGGGSWEAAKALGFSNVVWFKPADFVGGARANAMTALKNALAGSDARIVLFEAGSYDFSLESPTWTPSCQGTCSNGSKYTEIGGFCDCDAVTCVSNGYQDKTRSFDLGSNKTVIGLGAGATFRHMMMRAVKNGNLIFRNVAFRDLPGDVRAWDDALLFYPGDHVWIDHVSFSGFGRGSVVLSGSRVSDGSSFYAYRDAGWMTFSWITIDSSEPWRCGGADDSPYPFFTTNNPGLTFDHVHFRDGGGRNPAIDGEGAHFLNSAWESVADGLDGRGNAKLRVEGCYFDGKLPIRMDDPKPPTVYAPWNAALLTDKRLQVIFSASAWSSIMSDWSKRGLDMNSLNTNAVPVPPYPYGLDADPTKTLATVAAGAGIGKGNFPSCSVNAADKADYACQ
jgi:pectate lyase